MRIQDVPELDGAEDPIVLEWAAQQDRVVLTHDVKTMRFFADARQHQGLLMAGLILIPQKLSAPMRATLLEDLGVVLYCSHPREWHGRQLYLPLR